MFSRLKDSLKASREGLRNRISRLFSGSAIGAGTWDEFEEVLITSDVGAVTSEKLVKAVKEQLKKQDSLDGQTARDILKEEIKRIVAKGTGDSEPGDDFPKIILVVGVNGSGKTTSIAKLAWLYKNQGKEVLLAAGDTFRAAAIDQLKIWANRVGVDVIAHSQGGDPASVVYDALSAASSRHIPVLIVDTAGRLHTKHNLMEELSKIRRVLAKNGAGYKEEILLVIDATTGQNGLMQAKSFTEAVGLTGVILTKLDGSAKGGIVLAICDELRIPIKYIGTGEKLEDIEVFDAGQFASALLD